MKDLTNPFWIKTKAVLFVILGLLASGLLIMDTPTLKDAALLALAVWCFCRAYYFAFYVIEHYLDPAYKFSGLFSFLQYILKQRR